MLSRYLQIPPVLLPGLRVTFWLRCLFTIGMIISWTVLLSLWVEQYSIDSLLWFFAADGVAALVGGLLSLWLSARYSTDEHCWLTGLATLVSLSAAFALLPVSVEGFFALSFIAKGVFFFPLSLLLYRHAEEQLSPSDARRVMPLIKSGATIGVLLGAGVLLIALPYLSEPVLLSLWGVATLGVLLLYQTRDFLAPEVHMLPPQEAQPPVTFAALWQTVRQTPLLQSLLLLTPLAALIFTVIEFQFTVELFDHYVHTALTLPPQSLQASILGDAVRGLQQVAQSTVHEIQSLKQTVISTQLMHHTLLHDLSFFHLLFAAIALLFQAMVTPLALQRWGIIGTMLSYAVAVAGLLTGYATGLYGASTLRTLQHGVYSLGTVPNHMMYYVFPPHMREALRALYGGVLEYGGMLLALLFIGLLPVVEVTGLAIIAGMVGVGLVWRMREQFTQLCIARSQRHHDPTSVFHALEFLSHRSLPVTHTLTDMLLLQSKQTPYAEQLLRTIIERQDPESLPQLVRALQQQENSEQLLERVLDALSALKGIPEFLQQHAFTHHALVQVLEGFLHHHNSYIKKQAVLLLMRIIPTQEVVPFFLQTLQHTDPKLQAIYLRSLTAVHDPQMTQYILPYLHHQQDVRVRTRALLVLWQYMEQGELRAQLHTLLQGEEAEEHIAALYTLGEVHDAESLPQIAQQLTSPDPYVRLHALIALAKCGQTQYLGALVHILMNGEKDYRFAAFGMSKRLPDHVAAQLQHLLHERVSRAIGGILHTHNHTRLPYSARQSLHWLYKLLGKYDAIMQLQHWHSGSEDDR